MCRNREAERTVTRVDYGEAVIQTATGSGGDSSAAAGPASSLRHARILVVDDIEANRRLIARLLADEGYDIVFALNGRSAIEQVRRLDPDLVLMDVLMPDVTVVDVCVER